MNQDLVLPYVKVFAKTQVDTIVGHHANLHHEGVASFFHASKASSMPDPSQIVRTPDTTASPACFLSAGNLSPTLASTTALLLGGEDPPAEAGCPASEHHG